MKLRNAPRPATAFGVDIGKNLFHVVGLDAGGTPIQKATFRRDTLLQFFERAGLTLVGNGGLPRLAMVGTQDCRDGAHRPYYSSSIRATFREV